MKIKIQNKYLLPSINLLYDLSLKGKESRHRTRFIKLLQERLKEVEEERKQLAEEFSRKDKNGKPIIEDNKYVLENEKEFYKEFNELMDEEFIIEGANYEETLKTVKTILLECEVAFSGQDAMVYDYLCEQFEKGEDQ